MNNDDNYRFLENFVNTHQNLNPNRLRAELSSRWYEFAREKIRQFFEEPETKLVTYGYSSGDLRSHSLYRADNGLIFVVYFAYGVWNDACYFTEEELSMYFQDEENTIPDFKNPLQVQNFTTSQ